MFSTKLMRACLLSSVVLCGFVSCSQENTINVKYMLGGHYYPRSNNMTKTIMPIAVKSSDECYLFAEPTVVTNFGMNKGMRLLLVNSTQDTVSFKACDGRLYIVQEARDDSGKWKPIEYLPSSWCGNSYYRVLLASGDYWEFAAPRYDGTMSTQLRFRLTGDLGETLLVSNEFEGKINPEQFSVKRPYNLADHFLVPYQ